MGFRPTSGLGPGLPQRPPIPSAGAFRPQGRVPGAPSAGRATPRFATQSPIATSGGSVRDSAAAGTKTATATRNALTPEQMLARMVANQEANQGTGANFEFAGPGAQPYAGFQDADIAVSGGQLTEDEIAEKVEATQDDAAATPESEYDKLYKSLLGEDDAAWKEQQGLLQDEMGSYQRAADVQNARLGRNAAGGGYASLAGGALGKGMEQYRMAMMQHGDRRRALQLAWLDKSMAEKNRAEDKSWEKERFNIERGDTLAAQAENRDTETMNAMIDSGMFDEEELRKMYPDAFANATKNAAGEPLFMYHGEMLTQAEIAAKIEAEQSQTPLNQYRGSY